MFKRSRKSIQTTLKTHFLYTRNIIKISEKYIIDFRINKATVLEQGNFNNLFLVTMVLANKIYK